MPGFFLRPLAQATRRGGGFRQVASIAPRLARTNSRWPWATQVVMLSQMPPSLRQNLYRAAVFTGVAGLGAAWCLAGQMIHFHFKYVNMLRIEPPKGPNSGVALPARAGGIEGVLAEEPYRMVVLGDSLVAGVGAEDAAGLPKSVAKQMAEQLGRPVEWHICHTVGGDTPRIGEAFKDWVNTLPQEDRKFDSAIILCGANDMKRCRVSIKRNLVKLICTLRDISSECEVYLPQIAIDKIPNTMLNRGLAKHTISMMSQKYAAEKERLSGTLQQVYFVPLQSSMDTELGASRSWSSDQIHPSGYGYSCWGTHIGRAIRHIHKLQEQHGRPMGKIGHASTR